MQEKTMGKMMFQRVRGENLQIIHKSAQGEKRDLFFAQIWEEELKYGRKSSIIMGMES